MSKFPKVYPQSNWKIVFTGCSDRQSFPTLYQEKKSPKQFSNNIAINFSTFKISAQEKPRITIEFQKRRIR